MHAMRERERVAVGVSFSRDPSKLLTNLYFLLLLRLLRPDSTCFSRDLPSSRDQQLVFTRPPVTPVQFQHARNPFVRPSRLLFRTMSSNTTFADLPGRSTLPLSFTFPHPSYTTPIFPSYSLVQSSTSPFLEIFHPPRG